MKYIKSYIFFVLMVFAVTGCTMDDLKDDVNDLKDRVTLIEQQVKLLNDNLAVVGYILNPQNKTVSKVETVNENGEATKYVITLSDDTQLVLTIGKPGTVEEPVITIGEDGKWYINGVSTGVVAVGQDGKNGEGFPEFRVENGNWQVRFGTGAWTNVPGGEGIASGSLGDQIFESATVSQDGLNFIVTLKDGTVHTLPIVASLVCVIDLSGLTLDAEGYLVIEKDARVAIPVKIEGENPQVTYPLGWRAALSKLDNADEKGNNYQLFIYAPAAKTKAVTRASADNAADVTVQVQKGSFWAIDKMKVKTPKDYSNNLYKYEDGLAVTVGGLDILQSTYGEATEITANQAIDKGGVYFVSTNNLTLTYDLGTTGVDNLIIIPTTPDVTSINLTVNKQIYLTGTLVCQHVNFNNTINQQFPLRIKGTEAKILFNESQITGLFAGTKGLAMPNATNTDYLSYFEMTKSNIKIDENGSGLYLIHEMNCPTVIFENNIVYYSGVVPSTQAADGHLVYFKLFNGVNRTIDTELRMNSNTFVDVESSGASGVTGLVYCKSIGKLTVNNNIYWMSFPATVFATDRTSTTTVWFRTANAVTDAVGSANYGYSGNPTMKVQMFYGSGKPAGVDEKLSDEVFDTSDPTTFNKATGVFTPKAAYAQFGAQR